MTTTQAAPNGSRVAPPPRSAGNPAELHSADLPADKDHNKPFPAGAYHVPPEPFTPSPKPYRLSDDANRPKVREPLPHRCQFMFSDGRQCQMARSDIHPSLCVYHSEREEQLFGEPSAKAFLRGPSYDLPELFSAARDLSTAASVNRVLAQVFRLLAQRRISRQEAATFAKLGHLLLQSIRAAHAEAMLHSEEPFGYPFTSGEPLPQSPGSGTPMPPSTEVVIPKTRSPISAPTFADRPKSTIQPGSSSRTTTWSEGSLPESAPAASSEKPDTPAASTKSQGINTSAAHVCNSPEISTYKNAGDQVMQNEHLQKNYGGCLVEAR